MIYSLRGPLIHTEPGMAVIDCGGVGYKCAVSLTTLSQLPPIGDEAMLFTYMAVRDDSVDLYGFADSEELSCFKLLISVNGVSARIALNLLSDITPEKLSITVASGDEKTLTNSTGVGKKLASRIVLELKDKLGDFSLMGEQMKQISCAAPTETGNISQAASALVVLGYSQSEAAVALSHCDPQSGVEQMIKVGLRYLSNRK